MTTTRRAILTVLVFGSGIGLGPKEAARSDDAPPPLAGTWTWSWKDRNGQTHHHVLEMEGANAKLAAREQFDELPAVRVVDLTLDGKKIRFTVVRGERRAVYSGVVADADTINGTVTVSGSDQGQGNDFVWKAKRQSKPKLPPQPQPDKPEG